MYMILNKSNRTGFHTIEFMEDPAKGSMQNCEQKLLKLAIVHEFKV